MRLSRSYFLQALTLTALQATYAAPLTATSSPYPVAIWHGLGDSYTNPGLTSLGDDIKAVLGNNTYVHYVRTSGDSAADQKSTLFGNMNTLLHDVAQGLKDNPGLQDGFDAIGLSQGGVFWRGYVERYGSSPGYPRVRNLITLGSPHMGISSSPPCHPTDFFCKTTQWALKVGMWTPYAQNGVVPAQYFRNQAKIEEYLAHDSFLRDINNERANDTQPVSGARIYMSGEKEYVPRNAAYKKNIASLNNFVLMAFDNDQIVIPSTSPHFTLPSSDLPNAHPLSWKSLPLYSEDYIGLRTLDEKKGLHRGVCKGQHMQIDDECWAEVISWLGPGGKGRGPRKENDRQETKLVLQMP